MAQTTIAYLERQYTALESEITDALSQSPTNDLAIADLKYRKRIIADEIQYKWSVSASLALTRTSAKPALSHLNRLQRGSTQVCGLRCGQVASVQAANIRPGSCITQLNDVAFFVVGGNLILCEARPPLCLCKPINSVLWLAYCKLSTQPSLRPKLHNALHELHSCRVKSFTLAPYQSCDRESFQFGLQKEDKLTVYFFNVLALRVRTT